MSRKDYLSLLIRLAQNDRTELLKRLIEARVQESYEPVTIDWGEGPIEVRSPPLEHDEPDVNLLLYSVYTKLKKKEDEPALASLRRAVMELFMAALERGPEVQEYRLLQVAKAGPAKDLEALRFLARMVGRFRLVDSPELHLLIKRQVFGFLESGLPVPFARAITLQEEWLERASTALDVWVSVLPNLEAHPEHVAAKVEGVLEQCRETALSTTKLTPAQFTFLQLAFHALAKVQPAKAAGRWVAELSRIIERHSTHQPEFRHDWMAFCHHLAVVFKANLDWRSAFIAGLASSQVQKDLDNPAAELFQQSLDRLELLEEVRTRLLPRPAAPVKIPFGLQNEPRDRRPAKSPAPAAKIAVA